MMQRNEACLRIDARIGRSTKLNESRREEVPLREKLKQVCTVIVVKTRQAHMSVMTVAQVGSKRVQFGESQGGMRTIIYEWQKIILYS